MDLKLGVFLDLSTVDNGDLDLAALDRTLPQWRTHGLTGPDEVATRIAGADLVITNKTVLTREHLAGCPSLELVALAATGTNVVDLQAAREMEITVCNARDYCSDSVAQHALGLMLSLVTGQPWYSRRATDGEWSRSGRFSLHDRPIRELRRLTLGIIGYGAIGRTLTRLARSVGMNVLIGERRGRTPRSDRLAFRELVANADVVSIHCPLTGETRDMFDRAVLRSMKRTAILINTARGGIVNEQDLADALRAGDIGGAGVDVLSEEPPPPDHPLLAGDIPNLIVTPHNAWASLPARQALIDQLAEIVGAFKRGQPVNRVV